MPAAGTIWKANFWGTDVWAANFWADAAAAPSFTPPVRPILGVTSRTPRIVGVAMRTPIIRPSGGGTARMVASDGIHGLGPVPPTPQFYGLNGDWEWVAVSEGVTPFYGLDADWEWSETYLYLLDDDWDWVEYPPA